MLRNIHSENVYTSRILKPFVSIYIPSFATGLFWSDGQPWVPSKKSHQNIIKNVLHIKNSAVAEKSLAAHRLLKIKSTEVKSYQISAENCLRKRDWYGLVHFSQRKRCGNAAETRNATSFCSYVFPPSGNVTETWTIRFPQDFRNTETPYFTLWAYVRTATDGNMSVVALNWEKGFFAVATYWR